jgi:hypothetical protein
VDELISVLETSRLLENFSMETEAVQFVVLAGYEVTTFRFRSDYWQIEGL